VKIIIQGCGTGAPELGILLETGDQIKNQNEPEAELSLNSRTEPGLWSFESYDLRLRVPS